MHAATACEGVQPLPLPQNMFSPKGLSECWRRQSPLLCLIIACIICKFAIPLKRTNSHRISRSVVWNQKAINKRCSSIHVCSIRWWYSHNHNENANANAAAAVRQHGCPHEYCESPALLHIVSNSLMIPITILTCFCFLAPLSLYR